MNNKKIAQTAMLAALAIVFGYVENLFPLPIPVYGAKVGISNAVILGILYMVNIPAAWITMIIKTVCSALLFQGFSAFLYSFAGGVMSVLTMTILKKTEKFSVVGVSIAGGIMHNTGQLICAGLVLKTINIFYYFPILLVFGSVAGVIIGIITRIFSNSYLNVFQKLLSQKGEKASIINFHTYLGLTILAFIFCNTFVLNPNIFIDVLAMGFLGAIGNYFIVKALSCGELSALAPINSYKPVVALIL